MTAKSTRAVCGDCGKPAPASAYGASFCFGCYRERGFADPALLGGRPRLDDEPLDDDGDADR